MIDGKKVAGILIEVADDVAFVGIGVNVNQRDWPAELKGRAVSLAEAIGGTKELARVDVLEMVLRSVDEALGESDASLVRYFGERDALHGRRQAFCAGGEVIEGIVVAIDPLNGLRVMTVDGERFLGAGVTRLVMDAG
jgi:BirA family biotin operon repressor/biotin-[acetyl-CoA-carboxylase] ligase